MSNKIHLTKCFCINLEKRTERWERTQKEFEKLTSIFPDLKLIRFNAIENQEKPERGLAESFCKIIEENIDQEYIFIIEDDINILSSKKIQECLLNPPQDWDLISGGSYFFTNKVDYDKNWIKVAKFCSTHFLIIRNTMYDKFLKWRNNEWNITHIDAYLGSISRRMQIKVYIMHEMPVKQYSGYSDVRKGLANDEKNRNLPFIKSEF